MLIYQITIKFIKYAASESYDASFLSPLYKKALYISVFLDRKQISYINGYVTWGKSHSESKKSECKNWGMHEWGADD